MELLLTEMFLNPKLYQVTQRIMIYYRFVGYIEISGGDRNRNHTAETRKGVAVHYLTA